MYSYRASIVFNMQGLHFAQRLASGLAAFLPATRHIIDNTARINTNIILIRKIPNTQHSRQYCHTLPARRSVHAVCRHNEKIRSHDAIRSLCLSTYLTSMRGDPSHQPLHIIITLSWHRELLLHFHVTCTAYAGCAY